ncbi:MAG: hypothetical protein J3Q66DRAFT_366969 [Benniella sp.]|nr:MAG: hypothetical protein J3Q66DRAFT_366969 [Benniella sp.]
MAHERSSRSLANPIVLHRGYLCHRSRHTLQQPKSAEQWRCGQGGDRNLSFHSGSSEAFKPASHIMNAVILITVLSAGNSEMYDSTRTLYMLAKDGKVLIH